MTSSPATGGPGWYRGDCHVHSVRSGDEMRAAELTAEARDARLDFVVVTERNAAADRAGRSGGRPLVIFGQEVAAGVPAGTMTIHADRRAVLTTSLPPDGTAAVDWSPEDGQPSCVRVEVRGSDGQMAAVTNPIVIG